MSDRCDLCAGEEGRKGIARVTCRWTSSNPSLEEDGEEEVFV